MAGRFRGDGEDMRQPSQRFAGVGLQIRRRVAGTHPGVRGNPARNEVPTARLLADPAA